MSLRLIAGGWSETHTTPCHPMARCGTRLFTLQRTKEQAELGKVTDETQSALVPVVDGCNDQVRLLEEMLSKVLQAPTVFPGSEVARFSQGKFSSFSFSTK